MASVKVEMIFAARQLIEKTQEHGDSLFLLFVDLKKAYDSVPRAALWTILEKCCVPPRILGIIYGAKTWTIKAPDLRILTSFHNRCAWAILGSIRYQLTVGRMYYN